jgi:hypothetical protein
VEFPSLRDTFGSYVAGDDNVLQPAPWPSRAAGGNRSITALSTDWVGGFRGRAGYVTKGNPGTGRLFARGRHDVGRLAEDGQIKACGPPDGLIAGHDE